MKLLLLGLLLLAPARAAEVRAIWVTRFDYKTEQDVRSIISNCASLGFNTILFQVRGQADAYYKSSLEPWADRLGGDPGFDPLETACRSAKQHGVSLHAWMNVMPCWRGKTPPGRHHLAAKHPDWIVVGKDRKRPAWNDHYVAFNPCLPAVRQHVTAVARDIATRYAIDGLHLDYVRFIEGDGSYDEKTLSLFGIVSGGDPAEKPAEWTEFRRSAVTETVRLIRAALKEARPGALLTAAVYPTAKSRKGIHQDAERWVSEGLVDAVFPMTYNDNDEDHRQAVEEGYRLFKRGGVTGADGRPVTTKNGRPVEIAGVRIACYPGIGVYKHKTAEQTVRQVEMSRGGYAIFAYSSLFDSANDDAPQDSEKLKRARREALKKLPAR